MKILSCRGGLANLNIVVRCQLQVTLDSSAGVLRTLSLITMRQQQNQAIQQSPFLLPGRNKLVDYYLCSIGEVAELSLP